MIPVHAKASSWYLTACWKDTSSHWGGHKDRERRDRPPAPPLSIAHFKEELLVFWPVMHLATVHSRHKGYSRNWLQQGRICKNVQCLRLQRKSLWSCTEKTVLVSAWQPLYVAGLAMPVLGDRQGGTDHTWGVPQERRFPPVEFTHIVGIDFYILCGLFPNWADDTHSVAKVIIQNKSKVVADWVKNGHWQGTVSY